MTETRESRTFVLKDSRGNYCGSNSIHYNKKTKIYDYSYSEFLTNGFYTYQNRIRAEEGLKILQDKEMEINNGITFHIEEINRKEVIYQEFIKGVPKNPFIHVYFKEGLAIA